MLKFLITSKLIAVVSLYNLTNSFLNYKINIALIPIISSQQIIVSFINTSPVSYFYSFYRLPKTWKPSSHKAHGIWFSIFVPDARYLRVLTANIFINSRETARRRIRSTYWLVWTSSFKTPKRKRNKHKSHCRGVQTVCHFQSLPFCCDGLRGNIRLLTHDQKKKIKKSTLVEHEGNSFDCRGVH